MYRTGLYAPWTEFPGVHQDDSYGDLKQSAPIAPLWRSFRALVVRLVSQWGVEPVIVLRAGLFVVFGVL